MGDYYQLLGVDKQADAQEIKSAYRKLALKYHPDRNPGDSAAEEQFKKINEAYAVLSDPEKRNRYDRFGSVDVGAQFSGDIFDIFASVFGSTFAGSRPGQQRGQAGEDLEAELLITLEQARAGETVPLEVTRLTECGRCHGSMAEDGGRSNCPTCHGAGQVRAQAQSFFGTVVTTRACPQCHGLGEIITEPCRECHGRGRLQATETIEVNLPKGIDAGYRLRIPRQGNAGLNGGPAGDLYVYIELATHPQFTRDGDDIIYDLEVGLAQAALGSSFEVPTPEGPEILDIPPGTQPGTTFRLRGRGMPRLRQIGMGDEVVTVRLTVPKKLSAEAQELLTAYAEEVGEELHERDTLLKRIRNLFGKRKRDREAAEAS